MSLQAPLHTTETKTVETPLTKLSAFKEGIGCDFFLPVHSSQAPGKREDRGHWPAVLSECGAGGDLTLSTGLPSH